MINTLLKYVAYVTLPFLLGCTNIQVEPKIAEVRESMIEMCGMKSNQFEQSPQSYEISDLNTQQRKMVYVLTSTRDTGDEVGIIAVSDRRKAIESVEIIPHLQRVVEVATILPRTTASQLIVGITLDKHGIGYNRWSYVLLGVVNTKPKVVLRLDGDSYGSTAGVIHERITQLAFEEPLVGQHCAKDAILLGYEQSSDGQRGSFAKAYEYSRESLLYLPRD